MLERLLRNSDEAVVALMKKKLNVNVYMEEGWIVFSVEYAGHEIVRDSVRVSP